MLRLFISLAQQYSSQDFKLETYYYGIYICYFRHFIIVGPQIIYLSYSILLYIHRYTREDMRRSYIKMMPSLDLHALAGSQSNPEPSKQDLLSILQIQPESPHQSFFQTLVALYLIDTEFPPLLEKNEENQVVGKSRQTSIDITKVLSLKKIKYLHQEYNGSFSLFQLKEHALSYYLSIAPSELIEMTQYFPLLNTLHSFRQQTPNKDQFNILTYTLTPIQKGTLTYDLYIVYLDFIALDLLKLLYRHTSTLNLSTLIQFLKLSLPKILSNIIVSKSMFPQSLRQGMSGGNSEQDLDILYGNQILENIVKMCENYHRLIHKMMLEVIERVDGGTAPALVKQLIALSFKYYYLYYKKEQEVAQYIVMHALDKINKIVLYAVIDEIHVFFLILRKLGNNHFIKSMMAKYEWAKAIFESKAAPGIKKEAIMPFYNRALGSIEKIVVPARAIAKRYIQVYDRFSLLYFSLKCVQYDIKIKLFYIGGFNKPIGSSDPSLLFSFEKDDLYQGSLQILQPGIYMFQLDNQFSWVHSKTILYDICILSPIQILQDDQITKISKEIVFSEFMDLNQCSIDRVIGHVGSREMNYGANVVNISKREKIKMSERGKSVVYNLKMTKNLSRVYEYETEDDGLFKEKVEEVMFGERVRAVWKIEGYNISQVYEMSTSQSMQVSSAKILQKISMWINQAYHPKSLILQNKQNHKQKTRKNPLKVSLLSYQPDQQRQKNKQVEIQMPNIENSTSNLIIKEDQKKQQVSKTRQDIKEKEKEKEKEKKKQQDKQVEKEQKEDKEEKEGQEEKEVQKNQEKVDELNEEKGEDNTKKEEQEIDDKEKVSKHGQNKE